MQCWVVRTMWLVTLLFSSGCHESRPDQAFEEQERPLVEQTAFDPTSAGIIHGRVLWTGDVPDVPAFEVRNLITPSNPPKPRDHRKNPNAPKIDSSTSGVCGTVVFLRNVDPRQAKPWHHPPVTVEFHQRDLLVSQGEARTNIGFVRQASSITMVSHEKLFNALHADWAAFFSLPFPDADKPLTRALKDRGLVELTSAAGCYWMRGYLFVDDHPYYARTDATGAFELTDVPPGRYQIVCWMPNWHVKNEDRDPETSLVTRVFFHAPLEVQREVTVEASAQALCDFAIRSEMFNR